VPNLLPRPRLRAVRPGTTVPGAAPGTEVTEPDVITASGVRWLNLERPREADREWLEREFGFHPLAIEDVASRNQRPKLDAYDDYLFIVLHFGLYDKSTKRLLTDELDVFVGPDFLITLPDRPLPAIASLFERYAQNEELRESVFSKGTGYLLYKIVDTGVDASFPMLRRMGEKLDQLEDDIFEGRSAEIVRDLSEAKQEIINFRRIVRPMRAVLRDLERTKQRYIADDLDIYFDDITDAAERIWDVLENYKEVVEALEDSNESVLSHRLNQSLRVLTAFSVAMLPLTLLASVFGMNVPLPGQEGSPAECWVIIGIMLVTLTSVLLFFRRRGYL
jgi:magnesium transporter